LDILKDYARKHPRIRIITKENGTLSQARNEGLKYAQAPYIGFIDSDDYIAPEMFERLYTAMVESNADMVHCGTKVIYATSIPYNFRRGDKKFYRIKYEGVVIPDKNLFGYVDVNVWNKLYKKELIEKYNIFFPDSYCCEDAYFSWCYMSICKKIYYIRQRYYYYVRRSGSLMELTFNKQLGLHVLDHLKVAELFYQFLVTHDLFEYHKYGFWNGYITMVHCSYLYAATPEIIDRYATLMIKEFLRGKDISYLTEEKYNILFNNNFMSIRQKLNIIHQEPNMAHETFHDQFQNKKAFFRKVLKSCFLFPWYIYKISRIIYHNPVQDRTMPLFIKAYLFIPYFVLKILAALQGENDYYAGQFQIVKKTFFRKVLKSCLLFPWYIYKIFRIVYHNPVQDRTVPLFIKAYLFIPYFVLKILVALQGENDYYAGRFQIVK
jgi:glycosyltransferase involved in cell wall biosynthesis